MAVAMGGHDHCIPSRTHLITMFEDLANQAYNAKLIKAPSPFQCHVADRSSYSLTTLVSAFSGGLAAHTIVIFTFHKIMVTATASKTPV